MSLNMENDLQYISWLGHASFKIRDEATGNLIYYIDPFDLPADATHQALQAGFHLSSYDKADIIFITHAHMDHCSKDDVNKILKEDTTIVAPSNCFASLDLNAKYQKQEVIPGQDYTVKGVMFKTVPAYNVHPERLKAHPRENNWVGYVITVNAQRIYHAGDTDFISEMKSLGPIDVAMLPMGGKYTMNVDDAIDAANAIGAKITIPMHYKRLLGSGYKDAEEKLKLGVTKSKVVILEEVR